LAAGALTLMIATAAAVCDLAAQGARQPVGDESRVVHLFIPAAFLAVPMYRTMGQLRHCSTITVADSGDGDDRLAPNAIGC